jgi:hypothetical protein
MCGLSVLPTFGMFGLSGNPNWRGRLTTVVLLVLTSLDQLLLLLKILFIFFTKQSNLMRRSTVLVLLPQIVFSGFGIIGSWKLSMLTMMVTAINFILPSFSPFECETEFTEYSKETEKSFFIYQITQNRITINWILTNLSEHKQLLTKGQKAEK